MGEHQGLVSDSELQQLLFIFCKAGYKARETTSKVELIERKCLALFAQDYKYSVIYNSNGELCGHYPEKLVILEYEMSNSLGQEQQSIESLYDIQKIRELMFKSRFARCRQRFVMPIILYQGKHICRSATLSGGPELYGRSGLDYIFSGGESLGSHTTVDEDTLPTATTSVGGSNEWPLFDRFRGQDINLLKMLSVGCISDLMVENKKVKFGVNVSSSEKVDKEHRYADFYLVSAPYPGCEFFREYRENGFNAKDLYYDWSQNFVDAGLSIPEGLSTKLGIDWFGYRSWDLVKITQNYLKLFLHVLTEGDSGLLIHCISGWDRTPLFVSLLRLTLWADGKAHRNLTASEILYLTIAYDWMLFGHNLSDRLGKGEDIFFFCFNFLKHITSDEFSVSAKRCQRSVSRTDSESCMDSMVLLDIDKQCRGSNSSLNSNVSITSLSSTSSPILTSKEAGNEDTRHAVCSVNRRNGSAKTLTHRDPPRSPPAQLPSEATSPVAVPRTIRRSSAEAARSGASSTYGSWQLVSGAGSVKGYATSRDSPLTIHSDVSSSSSGTASSGPVFDSICEESERKRKLDEVRITFNQVYCSVVCNHNTTDGGSISSMIDSIAWKVGLKSGRSSIV